MGSSASKHDELKETSVLQVFSVASSFKGVLPVGVALKVYVQLLKNASKADLAIAEESEGLVSDVGGWRG